MGEWDIRGEESHSKTVQLLRCVDHVLSVKLVETVESSCETEKGKFKLLLPLFYFF